jgi:hypothetical protein
MASGKRKRISGKKLDDFGGNVALTAESCRIGTRTLSRKMRQYGLNKKLFKQKEPGAESDPAAAQDPGPARSSASKRSPESAPRIDANERESRRVHLGFQSGTE